MKIEQKGFSLIELMLATALLSMVMFTGYYAYSLYSDKWQERTAAFWQSNREYIALEALNRTLESAVPYVVHEGVLEAQGRPSILFNGDSQSILFVSYSPLLSSKPAVVRLDWVEDSEQSFLRYREASLNALTLLKFTEDIDWQHDIKLLNNVAQVEFQYLGWTSLQQAIAGNANPMDLLLGETRPTPSWQSNYGMNSNRLLPDAIKIHFWDSNQRETDMQITMSSGSYLTLFQYIRED